MYGELSWYFSIALFEVFCGSAIASIVTKVQKKEQHQNWINDWQSQHKRQYLQYNSVYTLFNKSNFTRTMRIDFQENRMNVPSLRLKSIRKNDAFIRLFFTFTKNLTSSAYQQCN